MCVCACFIQKQAAVKTNKFCFVSRFDVSFGVVFLLFVWIILVSVKVADRSPFGN